MTKTLGDCGQAPHVKGTELPVGDHELNPPKCRPIAWHILTQNDTILHVWLPRQCESIFYTRSLWIKHSVLNLSEPKISICTPKQDRQHPRPFLIRVITTRTPPPPLQFLSKTYLHRTSSCWLLIKIFFSPLRHGYLMFSVLNSNSNGLGWSHGRCTAVCSQARHLTLTVPLPQGV